MSHVYKIERWDVVMYGSSITKVPIIYIKPELDFLEYVRDNNYSVLVKIEGTGTIYDGKIIQGLVDRSCNVPNCRPNYFEETGYWVINLYAGWFGYPHPTKMGTVSIQKEDININKEEEKSAVADVLSAISGSVTSSDNKSGLSTKSIFLILSIIILILVILYYVNKK